MRCTRAPIRSQRGLRSQPELLVAAPQDAEQHQQLPERLTAGVLDGGDGGARAIRVEGHRALGGRGLDEHDRDVVGDHVLELARDPRALGEDRRLLAFGAVALELAGLLVEAAVEVVAPAQHAPQQAGDADGHDAHPGDAGQQVAGVVALQHGGGGEQHDGGDRSECEGPGVGADAEHEHPHDADEDGGLAGLQQAPAQHSVGDAQRAEGEQAGQRRAPGDGQRDGRQRGEDDRDPPAADVADDRHLEDLRQAEGERERGRAPARVRGRDRTRARRPSGSCRGTVEQPRRAVVVLRDDASAAAGAQWGSSPAAAGGRDSSASEVIVSAPRAADSSTSVASSSERA